MVWRVFGRAEEDVERWCRVSGFPQAGSADMRGLGTTVEFFTAAVSCLSVRALIPPGRKLTHNVNQGWPLLSLHARFNPSLQLAARSGSLFRRALRVEFIKRVFPFLSREKR
jgi:hypothetical protein